MTPTEHDRRGPYGPIDREPRRLCPPLDHYPDPDRPYAPVGQRRAERVAALIEPLAGIELGAYDRRIIEWLSDWEDSTVAVVASLLHRARAAGALPPGGA